MFFNILVLKQNLSIVAENEWQVSCELMFCNRGNMRLRILKDLVLLL